MNKADHDRLWGRIKCDQRSRDCDELNLICEFWVPPNKSVSIIGAFLFYLNNHVKIWTDRFNGNPKFTTLNNKAKAATHTECSDLCEKAHFGHFTCLCCPLLRTSVT